MRILPKNVDEDRHRQDTAASAERADDDADEQADNKRFNDHESFRRDVASDSPSEVETAGSMMSEAGLPAAISMPIARRAGVACS
jgi:hypothetical protein